MWLINTSINCEAQEEVDYCWDNPVLTTDENGRRTTAPFDNLKIIAVGSNVPGARNLPKDVLPIYKWLPGFPFLENYFIPVGWHLHPVIIKIVTFEAAVKGSLSGVTHYWDSAYTRGSLDI